MKSDPQRQEDGEEHEQNHSSEDTPARQPTKSQKGVMATKKIFKMPLFLVESLLIVDSTWKRFLPEVY